MRTNESASCFKLNSTGFTIFQAHAFYPIFQAIKKSSLIRFFSTLIVLFGLLIPRQAICQEIGLGSALFFPVDAPMAVSVPPIALRGRLFGGEYWEVEFGLTWYRMGGLSAEGLPFPMDQALIKPFNSFVIPFQVGGKIPVNPFLRIEPKFGGFVSLNSVYKVQQDHLAQAILRYSNEWRAMQTAAEIGQSNTFGLLASLFLIFPIGESLELKCGGSWYEGASKAPITGTAVGVSQNDVPVDVALDFPDAFLDFRGFELALGVQLKLQD